LESDFQDFEIVLVDNGSKDGSAVDAAEQWAKDPRLKVVYLKENVGFSKANNLGAQKAAGEILIFLNNDTTVDRDWLAPLWEAFSDRTIGAAQPLLVLHQDRQQADAAGGYIDVYGCAHERAGCIAQYIRLEEVFYANGAALAIRRTLFAAIGEFNPAFRVYYEATDLCWRVWLTNYRIVVVPGSKVYHVPGSHWMQSGRGISEIAFFNARRNRTYMLLANYELRNLGRYLPIYLANQTRDIILLTLHGRGQRYAIAGLRALLWNKADIREILRVRNVCQRLRKVSDNLLIGRVIRKSSPLFMSHEMFEIPVRYPSWLTKVCARPFSPWNPLESFQYRERHFNKNSAQPVSFVSRKILFVCPYVPKLGAHGGATLMYQVIRHLSQIVRVSVLAFAHDNDDLAAQEPLKAFCDKVRLVQLRPAPNSIQAYGACGFSEEFKRFFDPSMRGALLQMLSEDDYDIVEYEMSQMGQYIVPSSRTANVLAFYEVIFQKHPSRTGIRNALHRISTFDQELAGAGRADFVLTLTDTDRKTIARYVGEDGIMTMGVGCDNPVLDDSRTVEANSTVFLGSFIHWPNVEGVTFFAKKILPLLKEKQPNVKFHIIGSGPDEEIKKLDDAAIDILGWGYLPNKDALLRGCKVFVAPIFSGTGIRIKLLEAWSLGLAVVTTTTGCEGLEAVDGWNLLVADTPESFADRVLELFRNDKLCEELGRNGRATVQRYHNWTNITKRYEQLYSALSRKQSPLTQANALQ
jgi:GT2 family glycosyltransferase